MSEPTGAAEAAKTDDSAATVAAESAPSGSGGDGGEQLVVDVPEGTNIAALAAELMESGARFVLGTEVPRVRTAGELFAAERDGWPSTLLIPSPGGPVTFRLRVASSLDVFRKVQEAQSAFAAELRRSWEAMKAAGAEHGESSEPYRAASRRYWADMRAASEEQAGALFDAGLVPGWDEEVNGVPYNRAVFVDLCMRPDGAFLLGLKARLEQLVKPKLETLAREGKA